MTIVVEFTDGSEEQYDVMEFDYTNNSVNVWVLGDWNGKNGYKLFDAGVIALDEIKRIS